MKKPLGRAGEQPIFGRVTMQRSMIGRSLQLNAAVTIATLAAITNVNPQSRLLNFDSYQRLSNKG